MKLAEDYKVALVASALDLNVGATQVTKSINMKNFHRATFLIDVGTMAGANSTLKVYSGADDAALTSALAFKYAYGGATSIYLSTGILSDILAAETVAVAATGLVIAQATYPNFLLVVEVDASIMDLAAATPEQWLTLQFTDAGGATGLVSIFAVLEPRYSGNLSTTCFA